METGLGISLASIILGSMGFLVTIKTNLNRAERDELHDLRKERPEFVKRLEEKDALIDSLKAETYRLYQRLDNQGRPA